MSSVTIRPELEARVMRAAEAENISIDEWTERAILNELEQIDETGDAETTSREAEIMNKILDELENGNE
jgi:hypothetical protein